MKTSRKILIGLLAILILSQFIPIDKTNPPIVDKNDFISMTNPPQNIAAMLKGTCYDCHSHETKYPWYSNVSPIKFMLKSHIKGGRQHLNFSEWSAYELKKKTHKLEECVEEIEEGIMPMKSYTWMHGEAKLNATQKKELVDWFKNLSTKLGQ